MIDAIGEDVERSDKQDESTGCPVHQSNSRKKLTDEQIVDHSMTFLLASYETTANTLAYTSYLLALNPEIQEKLQREIEDYFEENPVSLIINHCSTCVVQAMLLFALRVFLFLMFM